MSTTKTTKKIKDLPDQRPLNGGWAPGYYTNTCLMCDDIFIGDKRAIVCAPCAYKNNSCKNCS